MINFKLDAKPQTVVLKSDVRGLDEEPSLFMV